VVQNDGGQWKFGETNLTREDYNGGSRFTSSTYAGLVIDTVEANPAAFSVYIGKSFAARISDFMESILDLNSSVVKAETAYRATSTDIEAKLAEIEEREKLLTTRYTTQFGAMEQSMSQFNSTKSMLENFVEAWKKQK
jgi:flagellar capping protein FliD